MLRFYGIRFNKQGAPERFSLSFALRESLHAGLTIYDHFGGDIQRTEAAIEAEINQVFQGVSERKRTHGKFRLTVAKWFRTRDIVRFVSTPDPIDSGYKLAVARALNTPGDIASKWQLIEAILLRHLLQLDAVQLEAAVTDPESDVNLTLLMVSLFFLEQDDELPPANLEMQFIRNRFPRIIWKLKEGLSATANPFWLPKNRFCRPGFLLTRIVAGIAPLVGRAIGFDPLPDEEVDQLPETPASVIKPIESTPCLFDNLLPEGSPDEIFIELEEKNGGEGQLSFLPESAMESLLSFQRMIQKRYWHDGVKHLLAIFRQLGAATGEICRFDTTGHFRLVSRLNKNGQCSDKQWAVFNGVFTTLLKLRVKRRWRTAEGEKHTINPLLTELGHEIADGETYPVRKLLLDPIFAPDAANPFRLGNHLSLIPERLFGESVHKHALLPGISAYLAGVWLYEYPARRGVAEKTTREIIDGTAYHLNSNNRLRLLNKMKSELAYMAEKCYIESYEVVADEKGNPWDDLHRLAAPEKVVQAIEERCRRIDANRFPERLIA